MVAPKVTREFMGLASISYPGDASITVSLGSRCSVKVSDTVVKYAFAFGLLSILYHSRSLVVGAWSLVSRAYHRVAHWVSKRPHTGTAVIYGATNKIGKAFATRFIQEGCSVILIDYSQDRLNKLQQQLGKMLDDEDEETIVCCAVGMNAHPQGGPTASTFSAFSKAFSRVRDITYFVNCRSIKRKEVVLYHEQKKTHMLMMMHYNMVILAMILKKVLKVMQQNQDGRVISVDTTYGQDANLKQTHPLFYATSQFSITLIETLMRTYEDLGIRFLPSFFLFPPFLRC